jgi:two-component system, response regulator PdtaR
MNRAGTSLSSNKPTIVVADENALVAGAVGRTLRAAGFDVLEAVDGAGAFEVCMLHAPSLAIIDYRMSRSSGVKMAHHIATRMLVPVVLMSADTDESIVQEAIAAGVTGFLAKPVEARQLLPMVRIALQRAHELHVLRSRVEQLDETLQSRRHASPAMSRAALQQMRRGVRRKLALAGLLPRE